MLKSSSESLICLMTYSPNNPLHHLSRWSKSRFLIKLCTGQMKYPYSFLPSLELSAGTKSIQLLERCQMDITFMQLLFSLLISFSWTCFIIFIFALVCNSIWGLNRMVCIISHVHKHKVLEIGIYKMKQTKNFTTAEAIF